MPDTVNVDGDPLEVLVHARQPVMPGAMMLARPMGLMRMIDGGEQDNRIIAVLASGIDPTYGPVRTVADTPVMDVGRLRHFFETDETLPDQTYVVTMPTFDDAAAAETLVAQAIAAGRNPQ